MTPPRQQEECETEPEVSSRGKRSASNEGEGKCLFRDRSLITGRGGGGATQREGGGQLKFYPYEKGDGKSFSHAEGGNANSFQPLRGRKMFYPIPKGGGGRGCVRKCLNLRFPNVVAPLPITGPFDKNLY